MSASAANTVKDLFARDRVAKTLGMELVECGEGYTTLALDMHEGLLNFNGTCHGGIIFAIADMAAGLAANSHGIVAPGINASISYHAAVRNHDRITARATEVARSKNLSTCLVEIVRKDGKLVASVTGSVLIRDELHDTPTR